MRPHWLTMCTRSTGKSRNRFTEARPRYRRGRGLDSGARITGNPEVGCPKIAGVNRTSQCGGLNRYEAGEEESLREGSSDPLGPEFCVVTPRGAQRSVSRGIERK